MNLKNYLDYLVEFIKSEVKMANCNGVVIGISGGIDSAVVSALAKKAFPNNHLCIWMPCESSELDEKCCNELVSDLELNWISVNLEQTFKTFKKELQKDKKQTMLSLSNTKARLRMATLYAFAQTNKYLVLGTDNAVEWHIGYFTKFGDGGCDLLPIVNLLKSEVKEAAKILGIPQSIIKRKPTASLWEGQTDEDEIGFSYDEIDQYLSSGNGTKELKDRVDNLHKISEHKRSGAKHPNNK